MKTLTKIAVAVGALACGQAIATPISGNSLQNELNALGVTNLDVQTDQYHPDEVWQVGGTGTSATTLLFELAGNASTNSFGIYDINNTNLRVPVFIGSDGAGAQGTLGRLTGMGTKFCAGLLYQAAYGCQVFSSSLFGFYLETGNGTLFSQVGLNNGFDALVAFEGAEGRGSIGSPLFDPPSPWLEGEYIFAWEDVVGGDNDYNDFVVMVESVDSVDVPEPGSLALFGAGLLGLGLRRRMKKLAA